jgi:hypothetical protein
MLYVTLLSANLTDYLINIFGWDTMQLLWDPLDYLFKCLEAVFNVNLDPLWEMLFT